MSNITVFDPASVPAHLRSDVVSPAAAAFAASAPASSKRLSIKGGVFRLFSGGEEIAAMEERNLDIVIVNTAPNVARTFYAGQYVEGQNASPACYSTDGVKPAADAAKPQCGNCASCPQNQKGSGQGDSRACRFSQRLAVVLANDVEGDVLSLQLPSTSIFGEAENGNKPLRAYYKWLKAQKVDIGKVVTNIKFDTNAATPKLFFNAKRWLTQEEFSTCLEKATSDEAIEAITTHVKKQEDAVEAPALLGGTPPVDQVVEAPKPAAKKASKPAPAPVVEDVVVAEPVVRAAPAPAPTPVANNSLAATLAAWDDEE